MAIFTTLITATKLLVKNMAKKKLKEKAKSFVTGDKDKKKVGKEVKREKITKIMGGQGAKSYGADQVKPVETQTQTISPSKFMGASTGDAPKVEPKSSGRVDFNSLNKRLDNIVGMTDMIVVATKATAQQKKDELNILSENRKKQEAKARQAKLKSKKPGLIGKAAQGIKKKAQGPLDAIMKFVANIAFGALAVFLINNAEKIKKVFQFIGDNLNFVGKTLRIVIFEFQNGFAATKQIFKLLKVDKVLAPVGNALKGIGSTIFKVLKGAGGIILKIIKNLPGIKQIGQVLNLGKNIGSKTIGGIKTVGSKLKNFVTGGGKKVASGIMKKGLAKAPGRLFLKLFGKKGAKAVASAGKAFKTIGKAAKAIKIPILGPIIVAVTSMLSGDPMQQTLFKAIGAGLGGAIGTLGGPLGMIVGEIVGEFLGNFLFELFNGDPSGAKGKELLKKRFDQIVSGVGKYGKMFLDFVVGMLGNLKDFVKEGVGRFVKNFPSIDISKFEIPTPLPGVTVAASKALGFVTQILPGDPLKGLRDGEGRINKIPNLALLAFPPLLLPHLKNSFFPSKDGEEKPKDVNASGAEITDDSKEHDFGAGHNVVEVIGENGKVLDPMSDEAKSLKEEALRMYKGDDISSNVSAVSNQASYEKTSAGTVILGEPSRSDFPSGAGGDAQFQRAVLLAADQKSMLNSYYKTQVKASLYKV